MCLSSASIYEEYMVTFGEDNNSARYATQQEGIYHLPESSQFQGKLFYWLRNSVAVIILLHF